MKELINYYYSMKINNIDEKNNIYFFLFDNIEYCFYPYNHFEKDVSRIVLIVNTLAYVGLKCHTIIENNNNEILTNVDNVNYILLKIYKKSEEISIFDIIDNNKKTMNLFNEELPDWFFLWQKRVDFIEDTLMEVNVDNIILKTIDYYIGLCENAIYYLYNTNNKYGHWSKKSVLSHRKIYYPYKEFDYYNPINYVIDVEVRDIAEYLKSTFFYGNDAYEELLTYLSLKNINAYDANLLFARLLYPNYYFDIYDGWLNEKKSSELLLDIIKKQKDYEEFLKKTYFELSKYAKLENIDWLIY